METSSSLEDPFVYMAFSTTWFKVAISVTDSDGLETYRSRCIGLVSADTQNKMILPFLVLALF